MEKVSELSKPQEGESTALVPSGQELDAQIKQKRLVYQNMISIVLAEAGNEKLALAWKTIESLLDKKEAMDLFIKLTENKDEFMKMMEGV